MRTNEVRMPSVIKAADCPAAGRVLRHDDLTRRAELFLAAARKQAAQMMSEAAAQAQSLRDAASAEGRLAAERTVEERIESRLATRLETALPALREMVDDLCRMKQDWLIHWERRAVQLATAIAERICRRELARRPEIALDLVREALTLAAGSGKVRVLLNPRDHAAWGSHVERLAAETSRFAAAEVAADERITPGGCRVETEYGAIDQQLETQLRRIEEELT